MKIFICGQKSFGKEVLKALYERGHEITGIAPAPQMVKKDKMVGFAMLKGIKIVSDCDRLTSKDIPDGTELVVAAHSHWLISQKIIDKCKYGGIGFHPSLLPRHRGQDAVRWTVHMGDYITGGTVYKLTDKCDGGEIILQKTLWVDKDWDYHELWKNLFPIGVQMIVDAVGIYERGGGSVSGKKQDERFATYEPSWERPRLKRNELVQLCAPRD
jgi:methionyl-tRNA formyltransferase